MQTNPTAMVDSEPVAQDLGPLAWVLDELRKSLDGATKALRRFVRDAELARGSDLAELDASHLRIARQQLHQAVGALEMVGLGAPAKVLRAMEALAQKFVQRPELCSDDAATKVERASFALTEFLEGVLKGREASPVALFAQYRDVMELVASERIHPADLWPQEWRWIDVVQAHPVAPLAYGAAVRARVDQAVLQVVRSGDARAAKTMTQISLGLASASEQLEPRVFWTISAAFFEAVGQKLCPADVYVKRSALRVIAQYTALARGGEGVIDRLALDLLFYCAQAIAPQPSQGATLQAVRSAYGLTQTEAFDYSRPQFGRFDPALMLQARKRIASATETWAALAGGDTGRLRAASDQFAAVADSMVKLHPESADLARALTRSVEATARSTEPPTAALAMEVATSVLFLEAVYDDLDPTASQMAQRCARLAQRLEHVLAGSQPEPMEPWMEDLYRRVSDRQTMGSVVAELRLTLAQVEKSLDQFFRNPSERVPLHEVPSQLAQMRGVFSVLGLDQASLAALRMRASVEKFLVDQIDERTAGSGVFEKLGNSLGAMGFLIDMLSYQRALAKKLFVYDEDLGEFKPVMGREAAPPVAATPTPETAGAPGDVSQPVQAGGAPAAAEAEAALARAEPQAATEDDDAEMREIFLEEAREVVQNGKQALAALESEPADLGEQTTLRRAFHTLKGSSRMVGLQEFGEAAWALEQLLNTWLADQKPANDDLRVLCDQAMSQFGQWVEDIASAAQTPWSAQPFSRAADSLRLQGQRIDLLAPGSVPAAAAGVPVESGLEQVEHDAHALQAASTPEVLQQPTEATQPLEVAPAPQVTPAPDAAPVSEQHEPSVVALAQDEMVEVGAPEPTALTQDDAAVPVRASQVEQTPEEPAEVALLRPDFETTQMFEAPIDAATPGFESTQQFGGLPVAPDSLLPDFQSTRLHGGDAGLADDATRVSPLTGEVSASAQAPVMDVDLADIDFDFGAKVDAAPPESDDRPKAELEPTHEDASAAAAQATDEQIKVIGSLRIGIPLYNVYLNEADEWSRRLLTELSEWELELHQPLRDSTIGLAHALGGSSATVGFGALSEIARALERAMQHVQLHQQSLPEHARSFSLAAEEIRRLLHQFAAGFLKPADPAVADALGAILGTQFETSEPVSPVAELPSGEAPAVSNAVVADGQVARADETGSDGARRVAPFGAGAAPLIVDTDDQSDALDALDADLFPIFEEEAGELFPQLGGALRQWALRPDNLSARIEALRVLHTLKGSARLAGAMRLGDMAHKLESAIEALGSESFQARQIEPMLMRFDSLQAMFDGLRAYAQGALGASDAAGAPDAAVASPDVRATTVVPEAAPSADRRVRGRGAEAVASARQASGQSVRVPAQLLDRLVNQAGEVIITRSRMDARVGQMRVSLKDLSGNLDRLRQQLREIEVQSESQMQSRMAQAKDREQDFDPLEFDRFTRVQELTRIMAESVSDVATVQRSLQRTMEGAEDDLIAQARQARELQRDLLRTRMVEFEGIAERLYAIVRQASKEVGKQVKLDIVGGSMDLDRSVLERMAPAFEHMLRNAVDHGIEDPSQREAAGKPPVGTVTITLQQAGNDVSVDISDDGAGLDLQRIRDQAVANGLVASDVELGHEQIANLIFAAGFSTAKTVTELSGRGIGLEVVRSEVDALGGRIETTSVPGQGTHFKLVVPLTTAVTQVVMLRLGDAAIGVPASLVEVVRRVPVAEIEQAYRSNQLAHGGEQLPFFWCGALLQLSGRSAGVLLKHGPVVVFRSAGRRIAAHVDEVLGNQEVVVKNLGLQLSRVPGLTGMSVLASGAVVLIYNPVALATVYGESALQLQAVTRQEPGADAPLAGGALAPPAPALAKVQTPLVMVVDDSITVRRVTQRLLLREGYRVVLAADGLQALERLQDELPVVVLSDIEMPRMDGFDLARNIRGDDRLKDLPIVMITSRIAQKHHERARELGVDHYLGKPYAEDELLGLIRHYCDAAIGVQSML